MNGTVVHGWCGFVEKSNEVVFQQMVLNKLWIPDVLIDIVKDFLYISATEVLRKFYKFHLNNSITDLTSSPKYMIDVYGRRRIAHWMTGHIYGDRDVQLQGYVCVTCGDFDFQHENVNGCCELVLDEEEHGLMTLLYDEESDTEEIPEVTWGIDIPVSPFVYADAEQAQFVLNALQQAREDAELERIERELWGREPENYDYDAESDAADYAEYMREVEMEAYNKDRR
jgi:hypothetical protein